MPATGQLFRLLGATLVILGSVAAFNFAVDPLQLFRPSRFFPAWYTSDNRIQAAGLIQSQSFDAVFMGSSLAVHFRASDISKRLGVHAVKLAFSGGKSKEQSFVLAAALKKKPKLVIWQLEDWIFGDRQNVDKYLPTDYYRRNLKGLGGYVLSLATMREAAGIVARTFLPKRFMLELTWLGWIRYNEENVDDINALPANYDIAQEYNAKNTMASFASSTAHPETIARRFNYATMVRNFESDSVALIEANPETTFKIYLTPYPILYFIAMRDFSPPALDVTWRLGKYVAGRLTKLPNVELYDFRAAQEITHDLNNYRDVMHHSPIVDQEILRRLAAGENRVWPDDPLASLSRLQEQIAAYRLR